MKFLHYTVLLLPLWWVLGLDQFVVFAFGGWALAYFAIQGRDELAGAELWLLAFLITVVISPIFIEEKKRYVEAAHNAALFGSTFFGVYYVRRHIVDVEALKKLYGIVMLFVFWAILFANLGYIFRGMSFDTPLGAVLPASLRDSDMLEPWITKRLSTPSWIVIGNIWRPKGLFTYSTAYSIAMAIALPMVITYRRMLPRGTTRRLVSLLVVITVISIVLSTTRIAVLAVGFYFLYLTYHWNRAAFTAASGTAIVILMLLVVGPYWDDIMVAFDLLGRLRGGGSVNFRSELYQGTLATFLQRPFFGWGAQMDVPRLTGLPALGSHSTYLNILFSYGIVGTLLFITFLARSIPSYTRSPLPFHVIRHLRGSWLIFGIICITEVYHLDNLSALLAILFWGASVSTPLSAQHTSTSQELSPNTS